MNYKMLLSLIFSIFFLIVFLFMHFESNPDGEIALIQNRAVKKTIEVLELDCDYNRKSADILTIKDKRTFESYFAIVGNKLKCEDFISNVNVGDELHVIVDPIDKIVMDISFNNLSYLSFNDYLDERREGEKYAHFVALFLTICGLIQFFEFRKKAKMENKKKE